MKILFITPSYKPANIYGGTTVVISLLAESLVRAGNEVTVFTTTANGKEELDVKVNVEIDIEGVKVFYFNRITKDPTHVSPRLWFEIWKKVEQYDIIHLHSWWNILILFSSLICHLRKKQFVLSPHGMLNGFTFNTKNTFVKKMLHGLFGKKLLPKSVLHVSSQFELNDCRGIIDNWKGYVIPNLVDMPLYNSICKKKDFYRIGYLSRIDPKKGLDILIEAVSKVKFPFIFQIAGNGDIKYIEHLKKLAETNVIDTKVEWHGWKDKDTKFQFLSSIDLFALTSYNENYAIVIIESLSVGTPVLLSDQVGTADFVRQHDLGWICPPNADEIHAALEKAYADKAKRERIRQEAPGIIRKEFSPEVLVQKYLEMYGEVAVSS